MPFAKSLGKGAQAVGYGGLTAATAVGTVACGALFVAGVATCFTGVGCLLALAGASGGYTCVAGTSFFARKTSHKAHRMVGDDEHHDSSQDVKFTKFKL